MILFLMSFYCDRRIISAIPCLVTLLSSTAVVGDEQWALINEQSYKYHQAGDYSKAVELAEKALNYAKEHVAKYLPKILTSINNLAAFYYLHGRYDEVKAISDLEISATQLFYQKCYGL